MYDWKDERNEISTFHDLKKLKFFNSQQQEEITWDNSSQPILDYELASSIPAGLLAH